MNVKKLPNKKLFQIKHSNRVCNFRYKCKRKAFEEKAEINKIDKWKIYCTGYKKKK